MASKEERIDPELKKALEYAQRLLNAAIDVVDAASSVQPNDQRARDPKVVALTFLCRSISNFRAAILLVQQEQVMEARAIVRLLYENLLWLGGLRERRAKFVNDMIADEKRNRRVLAELTLKLTSKHGADASAPDAMTLRSIIKKLDQLPTGKKLRADKIAFGGVVDLSYIEYLRFSLDSLHCSVTALGRHLSSKRTAATDELTASVIPNTPPREILSTVLHACRALMGAVVAANEIVGFASGGDRVAELMTEFENNGWAAGRL
jgi:hypothetical protein